MITDDAFTAHAAGYDDVADSRLGRVLRQRVHDVVGPLLTPASRVLDLGGGTGIDAAWMAPLVGEVVTVEPSPAMAQLATDRLADTAHASVHIASVATLASDPPVAGPFDLILANFGVINCVEPADLASVVARMLAPGGHVVLVPMPSFCPFEQVLGRLRRGSDLAGRRRPGPSMVAGYEDLHLRYPDHRDLAAWLPMIEVRSVESLGVALPPFDFRQHLEDRPTTLRLLSTIDRAVAPLAGRLGWGDHLILVGRRRNETGDR